MQIMEARATHVVVDDPDRETVSGVSKQYKMDNGLFVRLQIVPSQLALQLITKDGKRVLGNAGSTTKDTAWTT